jgi:hypothetical protein
LSQFTKYKVLFTPKIVTKLSKIWGWVPRSEIWDSEKPVLDPGSWGQKAPDPGSVSAALVYTVP